jgi:hypothetical protein
MGTIKRDVAHKAVRRGQPLTFRARPAAAAEAVEAVPLEAVPLEVPRDLAPSAPAVIRRKAGNQKRGLK